jgi:hypothetical protein
MASLHGDERCIKLEVAYGSDRQFVVVDSVDKRQVNVSDLKRRINKALKVPADEQVLFFKGSNITDHDQDTLYSLGIQNNQLVRLTRDPDLPAKSPKSRRSYLNNGMQQQHQQQQQQPQYQQPQQPQYQQYNQGYNQPAPTNYNDYQYSNNNNNNIQSFNDSSYSNFAGQMPSKSSSGANDVLKVDVSNGSTHEYVMVRGKKPLMIYDLKLELSRVFRIPPDQQNICFKGYNMHEYTDDAPLEAFGIDTHSQLQVWQKGDEQQQQQLQMNGYMNDYNQGNNYNSDGTYNPMNDGFNTPRTTQINNNVAQYQKPYGPS